MNVPEVHDSRIKLSPSVEDAVYDMESATLPETSKNESEAEVFGSDAARPASAAGTPM